MEASAVARREAISCYQPRFPNHVVLAAGTVIAVLAFDVCDAAPLRHGNPCLVRVQSLVSLGASVHRMARAQRHSLEKAQMGLGLTDRLVAALVESICGGSYLF